jgi:recombination protein RecR
MSASGPEIERLVQLLAKLPGLGPRSARRAVLKLFEKREQVMIPLAEAMAQAADKIQECDVCHNLDVNNPCSICTDTRRDPTLICVVETVGDLWALERASAFKGRYHVLGGVLSALDGVGPDDLNLASLISRVQSDEVKEVILALNATVDGQTTAHFVSDKLTPLGVSVTSLARGVPVGGELDYLDDGTLSAAFRSRRPA